MEKKKKKKENDNTCRGSKKMRAKKSSVREGLGGLTKEMRRGVEGWSDLKWQGGNSALTQACQHSRQPSQSAAIAMVTAECFL